MAKWLSEFVKYLDETDSFFFEMDRQLSSKFKSKVGESLDDFVLLGIMKDINQNSGDIGHPKRTFTVIEKGVFRVLNAELLNLDYLSPVTIGWKRTPDSIEFEWLHLDSQDIKKWLTMRRNFRIRTKNKIDFEINDPIWPHVVITFEIEGNWSRIKLENELNSIIQRWFKSCIGIHNISPLEHINDRVFSLTIDFGLTGCNALESLLNMIGENMKIKKVKLDCKRPE
ncbi:hypothetical protein [Methylomonas sp. MgM2]